MLRHRHVHVRHVCFLAVYFYALRASATSRSSRSDFIAVSSSTHFICPDDMTSVSGSCGLGSETVLPVQALDDLIGLLSGRTVKSPVHPGLSARFAHNVASPEVVVAVHARSRHPSDYPALLKSLTSSFGSTPSSTDGSSNINAPTSLWAALDADFGLHDKHEVIDSQALERIASDATSLLFSNNAPDVLSVALGEGETDKMLSIVRLIADRSGGSLAVVWTTVHIDDEAEQANDSALKGGVHDTVAAANVEEKERSDRGEGIEDSRVIASDSNTTATNTNSTNANSTTGVLTKTTSMDPPELTAAVLSGLLVGIILILIFIPGMLCLWNIQPPQTFESLENDELKKKMQ